MVEADPTVGQEVEVDIVALDTAGAGLTSGPIALHVVGALPGERVVARVEHLSPHRPEGWAALVQIRRASPERVEPACPAYGRCGGCALQHLSYPAQLTYKRQRVIDALRAAFGADAAALPEVGPIVPSPRQLGYRNRSKLVAGLQSADGSTDARPRFILGAYEPRSHRLVDLAGCRTVQPELDRAACTLARLADELGIVPYDETSRLGQLRYVILRANARGEVLVLLVVPSVTEAESWATGLAQRLATSHPEVHGVVVHENGGDGNGLFGAADARGQRTVYGVDSLDDEIGGVRLRLDARTFFQVNRDVAATLYGAAVTAAEPRPTDTVLDLYAGAGAIALTFAPKVGRVVAVEVTEEGAADTRANRGPHRVESLREDAAKAAAKLAADGATFDVVVLDPPRKGCPSPLLDDVLRIAKRKVVYVSCAPETLARDLARLALRGAKVESIQPFDLFPGTPHVECVVALRMTV